MNRKKLFKLNGPTYDSSVWNMVPTKKGKKRQRPDQQSGKVTKIVPAAAESGDTSDHRQEPRLRGPQQRTER